jgi:hypothetical protein
VEVKIYGSKKPNTDLHLYCLVHHFAKKIKLLACMNFVVKIKEKFVQVLRDLQSPVAASRLGCLFMGGIRILSFGHWIFWMRASARVVTSPPSIGTGRG